MDRDRTDQIVQAFAGVGGRGIYGWLWENYPALSAAFVEARSKGRRTDWPKIASLMKQQGITDRYKSPPKPEAIRRAWYRVVADVARDGYRPVKKVEKPPLPQKPRQPRPFLPEEMPEATPERSGGGSGEGEILPPEKPDEGAYNHDVIRRLKQRTIEAEPEQPRRKFRRGATFRGTEEDVDGKA